MLFLNLAVSIATVLFVAALPEIEDCELLDLTHEFDGSTIFWPGAKAFSLKQVTKGFVDAKKNRGRYFYSANEFSQAEHGGTHLDAPIHFAQKGISVEQLPLKNLIGEACVVDIVQKATSDPDYLVSIDDIRKFEQNHGRISKSCILLFRTGWGRYWEDRHKYLGGSSHPELHFPGVGPGTIEWLLRNRKFKAIGIDTASIDRGISVLFETHQKLSAANLPAFENVASLENLPERGATLMALPMKISGGSGAPVRMVAYGWNGVDDPCRRKSANNSAVSCGFNVWLWLGLLGAFVVFGL